MQVLEARPSQVEDLFRAQGAELCVLRQGILPTFYSTQVTACSTLFWPVF